MNDQSQMLNRSYVAWPPPPPPPPLEDRTTFQSSQRPNFSSTNPNRTHWKSKNSNNFNEIRPTDPLGLRNIYKFPNPNEFYSQNRPKSRRFYPRRKFNNRFVPFAPRNTTSFIIRAKKSGGIASLVSPCPVTPAILPTPIFSPSREVLVDAAKEEWGVDGYGTMKGLIRLRSLGTGVENEEEGGGGTSDSDVEERIEVERRLDHDLSRFEMVYPSGGEEMGSALESRFDDQDGFIARIEEENLTLKERLFLMEREMEDMRRRVRCLETNNGLAREDNNEVGEEKGSDNEGRDDVCSEKSATW